ncbi:hypothetical protein [Micromonospora sp. NPDC050495]|uniref:hypothetical protein n=1 Tax=Micromonospora sp. NPDC050495 TaxID=3154936 RepID=UPI0034047CBC
MDILITGAGSGLGRGAALGLARAGHHVIAGAEIWDGSSALLDRPDLSHYLAHQDDPQEMVDEMVRVIPAAHHPYRTTRPEGLRERLREFEAQVWDAAT